MKKKKHRFVVTVHTTDSKESAKWAVLAAFAGRKPDNCAFTLSYARKPAKRGVAP